MRHIQEITAPACRQDHEADALMFSSVAGGMIRGEELCRPEYWVNNLVSKVRFSEALHQMTSYLLEKRKQDCSNNRNKSGKDILLEIGPHSALQRPIKDIIKQVPGAKNVE
jgi:acyl transferase domain-containing protein